MTYLGFPVTFGYGEKTILNGAPYTHRGIDLGSFDGNSLIIQGVKVAITGATGLVAGPHTHVQAGRDEWAQQTINPAPYIGKGGKVVKVGTASQWGNYFCIRVGDVNVFYCHLQRALVKVGQIIQGGDMLTENELYVLMRLYQGRAPTKADITNYVGKQTFDSMEKLIQGGHIYKDRLAQAKAGKLAAHNHLPLLLRSNYKAPSTTVVTDPVVVEKASKFDQIKKLLGVK